MVECIGTREEGMRGMGFKKNYQEFLRLEQFYLSTSIFADKPMVFILDGKIIEIERPTILEDFATLVFDTYKDYLTISVVRDKSCIRLEKGSPSVYYELQKEEEIEANHSVLFYHYYVNNGITSFNQYTGPATGMAASAVPPKLINEYDGMVSYCPLFKKGFASVVDIFGKESLEKYKTLLQLYIAVVAKSRKLDVKLLADFACNFLTNYPIDVELFTDIAFIDEKLYFFVEDTQQIFLFMVILMIISNTLEDRA